jgi:hypothetical protein
MCGAVALLAMTSGVGCWEHDLQHSNMAAIPDGAPIPSSYLVQNNHQWVLDASQVEAAIEKVVPKGTRVATLYIDGQVGAASALLCPPTHPCLAFEQFLPKTNAAALALGMGIWPSLGGPCSDFTVLDNVDSFGVDLDKGGTGELQSQLHALLYNVEQVVQAPWPGIGVYFDGVSTALHSYADPQGQRVIRAGVWLDLHIEFSELPGATTPVPGGCRNGQGIPTILTNDCAGLPWLCNTVNLTYKLNRVPLHIGFVPDPSTAPPSLDSVSKIDKGAVLRPGFGLQPIVTVGALDPLATYEDDAAVWTDTQHDIAFSVDIPCEFVDNETAKNAIAAQMQSHIPNLGANIDLSIFQSSGNFTGLPCPLTSDPLGANCPAACANLTTSIQNALGDATTYALWRSFSTPLGPYANGAFLELAGGSPMHVGLLGMPNPYTQGDGTPVRIAFDLDDDPDHDGFLTPDDHCPRIASQNNNDTDGDGLGDACDPCPTVPSWIDNDEDHDGRCGADDNCPNAFNPSQSNCVSAARPPSLREPPRVATSAA